MVKYLAREVTIFPGKKVKTYFIIKIILLKMHKTKSTNLPEFKVHDFFYLPCLCKISLFVYEPIFKSFAAHFRTKGILNNDKMIFE